VRFSLIDDADKSKDPHIVSHVYTAPEECDLMDEDAWRAANPALGVFRSYDDMRDFADRAVRMPASENTFRWLYLDDALCQQERLAELRRRGDREFRGFACVRRARSLGHERLDGACVNGGEKMHRRGGAKMHQVA